MSIVRSQIYYINSANRVSGTSSNFNYQFDIPDGSNFDSCLVLSMSIPRSYYLVRVTANTLILSEGGVNAVITITPGNYDAREFATILTTQLNLNSPNHWIYSMTLNLQTAMYTFNVTGNTSQPSLIITTHLADQTGFGINTTNTFVSNSLTSTNVINFVSTNCVFLHSDLVDDKTSVLQEVYSNNTRPYEYMVHQSQHDLYAKKLKTNGSGLFNFSVTDFENVEINLRGNDIAITLLLYKKLPIADLFKKFLEVVVQK